MSILKKFNKNPIISYLSLFLVLISPFIIKISNIEYATEFSVISIFVGTVLLWLFVDILYPSILAIFSLFFIDGIGGFNILKISFLGDTFLFLFATFLLTESLKETGYIEKMCVYFLSKDFVRKSFWHFAICFFTVVFFWGSFISPTILFFTFLPIFEKLVYMMGLKKGDEYSGVLMMGLAFTTSITSATTPISHVFPVMAINFFEKATKQSIDLFSYSVFGMLTGIICFIFMIFIFKIFFKSNTKSLKMPEKEDLKIFLKEEKKGEKIIIVLFCISIFAMIFPSIFKNIFPKTSKILKDLKLYGPPSIALFIISIIRIDKKRIFKIENALKKISYKSLFMTAGALALGYAISNKNIMIMNFLKENILKFTNDFSGIMVVLFFAIWAGVQTNFTSNMVTATVVSTASLSLLSRNDIDHKAIICIIGLMSSYAFMTPPSMPHIGVASGSGYVSTKKIFLYGVLLLIFSLIISIILGYPLLKVIL